MGLSSSHQVTWSGSGDRKYSCLRFVHAVDGQPSFSLEHRNSLPPSLYVNRFATFKRFIGTAVGDVLYI